jgi:glycosyltransferase involved in cell wall biosynthesis
VVPVPNGIDCDDWTAPAHRHRRDILYLGRLEIAQKGLDMLLEAYAGLGARVAGRLLLAGDGPDEGILRETAARLGIDGRVGFLGRVPAAERLDLIADAAVVAMPSRYETFGMVAAEALAAATPVVAFDIPCLQALVRPDVGIRVPAFDVPAFGAALATLLANPRLARDLGDAGPAAVADLRWDVLARRQEEVYLAALAPASTAVGRHRLMAPMPVPTGGGTA